MKFRLVISDVRKGDDPAWTWVEDGPGNSVAQILHNRIGEPGETTTLAERVVACVSALDGIDDVEGFVAAAKVALAAERLRVYPLTQVRRAIREVFGGWTYLGQFTRFQIASTLVRMTDPGEAPYEPVPDAVGQVVAALEAGEATLSLKGTGGER